MGYKDHSLVDGAASNALDPSNRDNGILIRPWPVLGMYQPDAIGAYTVDGVTYSTEDSRPFVVMELIRGLPITSFCTKEQAPVRARATRPLRAARCRGSGGSPQTAAGARPCSDRGVARTTGFPGFAAG